MDKQHHGSGNNNGGFLLGILVGVALTLLLVTKKGRKILRMLTDEGIDKLSEWETVINDVKDAIDDDEDNIPSDDYIREPAVKEQTKETPQNQRTVKEQVPVQPVIQQEPTPAVVEKEAGTVSKLKSSTRRFFRGAKKK